MGRTIKGNTADGESYENEGFGVLKGHGGASLSQVETGDGGMVRKLPEEISKLSLSAITFICNQIINNKCSKVFQWHFTAHMESSVNSSAN